MKTRALWNALGWEHKQNRFETDTFSKGFNGAIKAQDIGVNGQLKPSYRILPLKGGLVILFHTHLNGICMVCENKAMQRHMEKSKKVTGNIPLPCIKRLL